MRRGPRGGPGEFARRLARAEELLPAAGAAREPLAVLVAVLRHQEARSGTANLVAEVRAAVAQLAGRVPGPLEETGLALAALPDRDLAATVEAWIDDLALVDPLVEFWLRVAAAPVLERAARERAAGGDGDGPLMSCPACGGPPQVSVIAEESGEFMAGSPRSLVCGRCSTWWPYPRVTCPSCGEEDTRRIRSYLDDHRPWARVDTCESCRSYIKTFDLRAKGAVAVIPLVDDVATLTLDIWANDQGFTRPARSLAGV